MKRTPVVILWTAGTAIALYISALSVGCGSTQMVHSWKSPTFQGPSYRKVLVIGRAKQPDVRRIYEDAFVKQFAAVEVTGLASYPLLPDAQMTDRAAIDLAVAQSGADAVLVTRLVKIERQDVVVPPEPGVQERVDSAWPGTYTPVVAGQIEIVTLESRLFQADTGQIAWSGTTQTFDAADLQRVIADVSRTVVKQLVRQKLL